MRRLGPLRALAALAVALAALPVAADVGDESAWIGAPPPGATTAAGVATFSSPGPETVAIVGAHSECCERIEFHETVTNDGIARMRRLPALVIPPGGTIALDPAGVHLMLIRPQPLAPGDRVTIRFASDADSEREVGFEVRGRDAAAEDPHDHHHHHAHE